MQEFWTNSAKKCKNVLPLLQTVWKKSFLSLKIKSTFETWIAAPHRCSFSGSSWNSRVFLGRDCDEVPFMLIFRSTVYITLDFAFHRIFSWTSLDIFWSRRFWKHLWRLLQQQYFSFSNLTITWLISLRLSISSFPAKW